MICLDTNVVIAAINGRSPVVRTRLEAALVNDPEVGLPTIVLYELWFGVSKSARMQANSAALDAFLTLAVTPWPFDADDSKEAGEIRATLERAGTPIGPYDVMIAAQARRRGAILVTANTGEFARVPGLMTRDWMASD